MATTVIAAFEKFQSDTVNLMSSDTDLARRSRDWLYERINEFPGKDDAFPELYAEMNIPYGSFERRTKIRPLDDIDMIACLHATGGTYATYSHDDIRITVPDSSRLSAYRHDRSTELNSTKIINKLVRSLSGVAQYRRAEINRRGEAATLQLGSYDWNFDVVPAFFTTAESDGRTYYLIPNGSGHWKKTDPRIDRDRVARVNAQHDGNVLNVIRCAKYWQKRPTMVTMPSYLLETIVVNYFEGAPNKATPYVDVDLAGVFIEVASAVLGHVADPKGIQTNINDLEWAERLSISRRAIHDAERAQDARRLEQDKYMRGSIEIWQEIFGDDFPAYG